MEPKELSPDIAGKILDADFQNIVKKVAAGKPLTVAERARIESRAAGSADTLAYAQTLVELAAIAGRHGLVRATCLRQALVVTTLLRRRGLDAQLQLGVQQAGEQFGAHAWVELAGAALGQPLSNSFSPSNMRRT